MKRRNGSAEAPAQRQARALELVLFLLLGAVVLLHLVP